MPTTKELAALLGLDVEIALVGPQRNVPGTTMRGGAWQTITVHETANRSAGADARMHQKFVKNGGGTEGVSFTYAVDSKRAVQILPENWVNYAQGTVEGNTTSLSIETCVNSDGDWQTTKQNLAKLLACLLYGRNRTIASVLQHNAWYGKNCPSTLRREIGGWGILLAATTTQVEALKAAGGGGGGGTPDQHTFPETGFTVKGKFWAKWQQGGLERNGYPISEQYQDGEYLRQWFENARMRLGADGVVRYDAIGRELKEQV